MMASSASIANKGRAKGGKEREENVQLERYLRFDPLLEVRNLPLRLRVPLLVHQVLRDLLDDLSPLLGEVDHAGSGLAETGVEGVFDEAAAESGGAGEDVAMAYGRKEGEREGRESEGGARTNRLERRG
jgi:hypothetical protein